MKIEEENYAALSQISKVIELLHFCAIFQGTNVLVPVLTIFTSLIKKTSGSIQLNSLSHLELVVNSKILLPVKVSHGDLQLVILLAGQSVQVVKAKPALS